MDVDASDMSGDEAGAYRETTRPYRAFGSWLRERRLARRLTQAELSRLLAYEVSYVRKVEWGTRRPSQAFLARIAQVFDLPPEAVPSATFGVRGPQLPVPATELIDRREIIQSITDLSQSGRLVTLTGAPGIGKTRIAIEIAQILDRNFDLGSTFVALDTLGDAGDVPPAIARSLGLGASLKASNQAVINYLQERELLLVCDGFDHVLSAREFVAEILAHAPGVRVLATSREPLHLSGETYYSVPPLAYPNPEMVASITVSDWPAVALFESRARLVQHDFSVTAHNAATVVAICAALEGVPLAIELIASAMRFLSPEALLDRIDRALDIPVSSPRDVSSRHYSVRAAIDWSFERLSHEEQAIFARLGVFVGGFSLDNAATICSGRDRDINTRRTAEIVASLVEKSLVEAKGQPARGVRFRLLEVVRQYATDRLEASGESHEYRRLHAEHYTAWAESVEVELTGGDQARRLADFDTEQANVRTAIAWAVRHDPTMALRLCGATLRWWQLRRLAEGRICFEAALASAAQLQGIDVDLIRVKVLNGAGILSATLGEYGAALSFLGAAMDRAMELRLDGPTALSHLYVGIVAEACGDYSDASAHFKAASELYGGLSDRWGVAHAWYALGAEAVVTGNYQRALDLYAQSLNAFRLLDDDWSEAVVAAKLGWCALAVDRPLRAEVWYERSLEACRSLEDERGIATALAGLARVGRQLSVPPQEVRTRLEEAVLLFNKVSDHGAVIECLEDLAAVAAAEDDWERAAVVLAAAAARRRATGATLFPGERGRVGRVVAAAQDQLDPIRFEAATARGDALGVDEAVAIALRRPSARVDP